MAGPAPGTIFPNVTCQSDQLLTYRFYRLDSDQRFRGVDVIEASHDDCARQQAHNLFARDSALPGYELWQGGRPVDRRYSRA